MIISKQAISIMEDLFKKSLQAHQQVFADIISDELPNLLKCGEAIWSVLSKGKKILICGNGGSAADAQHLAAELVGRYESERRALPGIALTTDTSALTALANDYSFERIFARQVEALAQPGDALIAITTSGNSLNVLAAVEAAKKIGCLTIGLTGKKGGNLAARCDECVLVPAERTARIQEAHICIIHLWCEMVDAKLAK